MENHELRATELGECVRLSVLVAELDLEEAVSEAIHYGTNMAPAQPLLGKILCEGDDSQNIRVFRHPLDSLTSRRNKSSISAWIPRTE